MLGILGLVIYIRKLYRHLCSYYLWWKIKKYDCLWLELGSGKKKGADGWVTVDLYGADISHDLSKGIPLDDESVDRIYTSHMLEHIPYKGLVSLLAECHRVLKVNGELSVCVPNAGLYIRAYLNAKEFREPTKCYAPAIVDTGSALDQVNYIAYMDGQHNYLFDEQNLVNILKKTSFSEVNLRPFDPNIDHASRLFESIYASALK